MGVKPYVGIQQVLAKGSSSLLQAMKYSRKLGITAFLAILTVSCLTLVSAADGDQPVYVSLVVSSAPTLDTSKIVSSVDQALQLINSDVTVLSGYNLQYPQVLDSQVKDKINKLKMMHVISTLIFPAAM